LNKRTIKQSKEWESKFEKKINTIFFIERWIWKEKLIQQKFQKNNKKNEDQIGKEIIYGKLELKDVIENK
jgi:hypothetical protein